MKLMRERDQVREVAGRWRESFGRGEAAIALALDALDTETASAADVEAIVGGPGWAKPIKCDECKTETWDIVQIGEEPDDESSTAWVCVGCLRAALALFDVKDG